MTNILLILSSPAGDASVSAAVSQTLLGKLRALHGDVKVVQRDLGRQRLPHIGEEFVVGRMQPADAQTPAQKAAVSQSDEIIKEVQNADIIVIASAMINFGISSTLKTWFDYLISMGKTFSYSEAGPKGLVTGKKVYVVAARGGIYSEGAMKAYDYQEPYLKILLGFIGMTDVEVIPVEGLAMGPDAATQALAKATTKIEAIAA
ncbi:MAG: FMN-dependent NADH-azoreductase [Herbaspirillum sp.]|jgi:FMN-dependent NADH-azoreductase|nr:FMN-dependent NADH-azoreductase [Herbaspirillum sp.]